MTDDSPRLTRGEYWILESAVEAKMPLRCLVRPDLDELLNKPAHGLGRDALTDAVARLVAEGCIRCESESRTEFAPSRAETEEALWGPRSSRLYYFLTKAGGAVWEAFAAPDWNHFIDYRRDCGATEVVCADERLLRRYLVALRTESVVDEPSVRFDRVVPWDTTYWRQLPLGHRLRCFTRERETIVWASPPTYKLSRWYRWG